MLELIRNLSAKKNDEGASAVEYGLLVAGIAALIVALVFTLGGTIKDSFQSTCDTIASGPTAGSATC